MKKVFLVLLVLVLAGAGVGYYMWHRPPATVEDKKSITVDAEKLANAFTGNEQQANALYLNQVLDVQGTVAEVSQNQDGHTVITFGVSDPLSGVQCTMRDRQVKAEPGQTITIKGFCNGYTVVVLLSDCIIK